jgi:transposase
MQLDSLLEEIEGGNDTVEMREKLRKKKEESFEERILKEIEDLEDL